MQRAGLVRELLATLVANIADESSPPAASHTP